MFQIIANEGAFSTKGINIYGQVGLDDILWPALNCFMMSVCKCSIFSAISMTGLRLLSENGVSTDIGRGRTIWSSCAELGEGKTTSLSRSAGRLIL